MASKAVKGINETIAKIQAFGKETEKMINAEIEAIVIQIEGDAKKLAPKNFGKLQQSISHAKIKSMKWKVTVNEIYGAYMEFGTGTKVQVPREFADIASQFKGKKSKGNWKDALEALKVWCRSKGIGEKAAYPILAKILGAGVNPQPFLYPAYKKGEKDLIINLERLLKNVSKKI